MSSPSHYRADVDGLRALAVIPVVLFHLGLGCPGGYVGVDIFFVISGFLITSILLREIASGAFSLAAFWERRIRRIVPALFVVVLVTTLGAGAVLYPEDYRLFGKEVISQATLVANFYYWQQDGYFDAPAEKLALLHMWSLAVEEQFYLIFPFCLAMLHRRRRRLLVWFGGVALLSFVWSAYSVYAYPRATFYLLPARAWELLLGSLLAIWQARRDIVLPRILAEVLSWAGLGLIVSAIVLYSAGTIFPGIHALAPCLGAALFMASNQTARTSLGQVLSLGPFVFIGKISYSLYLWHWPLIVLFKAASIGELSLSEKIALLLVSLLLAWLSWKYVETPFRKSSGSMDSDRRRVFKSFAGITCASILLGTIIYKADGFESRLSPSVLQYVNASLKREPGDKKDLLEDGKMPLLRSAKKAPDAEVLPVLLWGDSHARALLHLFDEVCVEANVNIYVSAFAGTTPLLGVTHPPRLKTPEYNDAVLAFIKEKEIKTVILAGRWSNYALGDVRKGIPPALRDAENPEATSKDAFKNGVERTLMALAAAGVDVWIMKQVPDQKLDPPYALANVERFGWHDAEGLESLGITEAEHREFQAFADGVLDAQAGDSVRVLDPLPHFLTPTGHCRIARGGYSLYHDQDHLSDRGALELRPLFAPLFETWGVAP